MTVPIAIELNDPITGRVVPLSVNYFPHRECNYRCEFCFHTEKTSYIAPLAEAKRGLRMLAEAGMKKLNISGGEPFLRDEFLGEIIKFSKVDLGQGLYAMGPRLLRNGWTNTASTSTSWGYHAIPSTMRRI